MEKGHQSGPLDSAKNPPVTTGWKDIVRKYQQPSKRIGIWQLANTLIPYALLWVAMFHAVKVSWWLVVPLAVLAGALLGAGLTIPDVFLLTGLVNALFATYVCVKVPAYGQDLRAMLGRTS